MLLMFILGLVVSAIVSTREARQEAGLSTPEMLREETMDQLDARRAFGRVFLDEASIGSWCLCPWPWPPFALVWLIGGWSLRPLARASRQAAAIGPANPTGRLYTNELPREIRPLVKAVNGALERLDQAYAAQRQLVERLDHAYAAQRQLTADAAHELRTPLAVLSLRLQQAKLDAAADWPAMERDLAQMSRLVGQLLELARVEDPARLGDSAGLGPVNLARLAREAAAMVLPLAEERERPLEVEAAAVISFPIGPLYDRTALSRARIASPRPRYPP